LARPRAICRFRDDGAVVVGSPTHEGEDAAWRERHEAPLTVEDVFLSDSTEADPVLDALLEPHELDMSELVHAVRPRSRAPRVRPVRRVQLVLKALPEGRARAALPGRLGPKAMQAHRDPRDPKELRVIGGKQGQSAQRARLALLDRKARQDPRDLLVLRESLGRRPALRGRRTCAQSMCLAIRSLAKPTRCQFRPFVRMAEALAFKAAASIATGLAA
jgi:hypothetical protein